LATKKKRIYELAKEYGMTGQALATKLKELGITEVKGHMTALDEFQLLKVQGTLEANGIVPQASADTSMQTSDGLTVKKRKKKKKVTPADFVDEAARAAEPAPAEEATTPEEPEPALPTEPVAEAPEPVPEPAPEPEAAPEAEPAPLEAALAEPASKAEDEAMAEQAAPPLEAPTEEVEAPVAQAQPTEQTAQAEPEAGAAPAEPGAEAEPEEELQPDVVKPGAKRRPGKVVGFVDLSKVQSTTAPRRPESRRLRSKDDVAPDVQPTLGHDRKRALMRGDHASRGQLSAAQLREKESGRFLRRRGQQQQQQRGGGGGRTKSEVTGSPFAGSQVKIEAPVTIKKLAEAIAVKASQVVGKAFTSLGMMGININSVLDEDTAGALGLEYDVTVKVVHEEKAEDALLAELVRKRTEVEEHDLVVRPPTVAFLGHVDHGKTTLLDAIRSSRVVQGESGGITQHLGAYQVQTQSGNTLTVIDTPGHEAFTAMRLRGAQAVDIVVLVVAADDGVMPSTIEAINHAKAAGTPIVVAINKMDRPEANAGKVKQQLTSYELLTEEYGGETAMIEVSALKATGIDELLERVFLESEVLELKSHSKGPAAGIVLEAEVQEGKGRVAYLLVKDGTLNRGDIILAGEGYGRVRSLHDDRSKTVQQAGPSTPVEVSGLSELPSCGDEFHVVTELEKAREVAEERSREKREMSLAERRRVTNENLLQAVAEQAKESINIILKADVQGSLQALEQQLEALQHDEVEIKVLHAALGTVTESDVNLATPSNARVFAFRVGVHDKGRVAAERAGIEILHYEVIYELLDDIRAIMEGQLAPEMNEEITGHVEVRRVFPSSKFGNIAGSYVLDGEITRDSLVRITREGELIHTGSIASLRREKDDVKKVREAFECGVLVKNFDDWKEGDVIEAYKMVAVKRLLKI
jgi:translation initiation factor IF-2